MQKIQDLIGNLDFYAITLTYRLKGKKKFSSFLGGIFLIAIITFSLYYFMKQLLSAMQKQNPIIVEEDFIDFNPLNITINNDKNPFAFYLFDFIDNVNWIPDPSFLTLAVEYVVHTRTNETAINIAKKVIFPNTPLSFKVFVWIRFFALNSQIIPMELF